MTVRSVTRALAILDCFREDSPTLALHQISARLDLAKSTTHRLLTTLTEAGYLVQRDDNEYCLSLQLLRLAGVVANTLDIADIARVELMEVATACVETVEISMLTGDQRVCVDVIESPSRLKSIVQVGEAFSLFYGATGLTFLAFMPEDLRLRLLRGAPRDVQKQGRAFTQALEEIAQRGYAHTVGQRVEGAAAISAPIFDMRLDVRYCMTITGPAARMQGRETEFGGLVTEACSSISAKLGATR